ncbi:rhodanese-like domain-containing protein [Uliginosibacterium aquaticum]|uniref:Rhodanese-like domain-containing protein n=1 Tax=Uliginosibacterium aquaticum TaxID=2731212 RepID=A0ABX2IM24_9RHOO|nr:rhodanese-like domain-containing protein [Uliginosibacterium aquaticum]NSL55090.1 rhodanese-like domain-containing protein [Uliginosibacterium aquaticum]
MTTAGSLVQSRSEAKAPATKALQPVPAGERLNILQRARESALGEQLPFAGGVTPAQAWDLFSAGEALLVDVRSAEERKFVGHVPGSLHVAWANGTALTRNPRFVRELEAKAGKEQVILLLCRSGKRSALAAEAAAKAGFNHVFNVLEGFEGDLNDQQQRGEHNGWRYWGLPWNQE